ncbi:TadE/TadG family type IV pilus assembly protein [Oharaeibacter diazotrophicus]|uniref:Flp pilus assembly protein TadG n=1 Tax=Oharaeibacter diazotrophicus TaxID=1920512 RepID=A0A4R6RJC3_9HYPH|nr:TadE/TadG family type IV pilus assembly protein [Oharaeibacter diazotrophicus]TDP86721.1 Flp pilus assembly protein TadG [Oharaeibacter diazotrophicus]GLS78092.1 hypothetical protein GCM10007904_34290 [Oharaeibacter diazotrophicus]
MTVPVLDTLARFGKARGGNAVVAFVCSLPVLFGAVGAAVDYSNLATARASLQTAADAGALQGARELRLAGANRETVLAVAEAHARQALGDDRAFAFQGSVSDAKDRVTVTLTEAVDTYFLARFAGTADQVQARAEARVLGGVPSCVVALDPASSGAITVTTAKISAPQCGVRANSVATDAVVTARNGAISAGVTCSGGGVRNGGTIEPAAQTDCPPTPDPLADRPPPSVGPCTHTNYNAIGIAILTPGVYCGGIKIRAGTVAKFLPGNYIVKDGPLEVANTAVVVGLGVGFYLTGAGAVFDIAANTSINLTAPLTGPLAGMLFFEDRANPEGTHRIESRDAPVLLGTFYLPKSRLEVGAPGGIGLLKGLIGALSAWTIVIAKDISVADGLNLTLNANFDQTKVPTPNPMTKGDITLAR